MIMVLAAILLTVFLRHRQDSGLINAGNDAPSITIIDCGQLSTCTEAIWTFDSVTTDSVE